MMKKQLTRGFPEGPSFLLRHKVTQVKVKIWWKPFRICIYEATLEGEELTASEWHEYQAQIELKMVKAEQQRGGRSAEEVTVKQNESARRNMREGETLTHTPKKNWTRIWKSTKTLNSMETKGKKHQRKYFRTSVRWISVVFWVRCRRQPAWWRQLRTLTLHQWQRRKATLPTNWRQTPAVTALFKSMEIWTLLI